MLAPRAGRRGRSGIDISNPKGRGVFPRPAKSYFIATPTDAEMTGDAFKVHAQSLNPEGKRSRGGHEPGTQAETEGTFPVKSGEKHKHPPSQAAARERC